MFRSNSSRAQRIFAMVVFGWVSACGGSTATTPDVTPAPTPTTPVAPSTPSTPTTPTTPTTSAPTLTSMTQNQTALISDYSPISYTSLSTIPISGSAIYEGVFSGDLSNQSDNITDSIVGELDLTVNFNPSSVSVSGSAHSFRDEDGAALSGELTLSAGALDRGGDTSQDATLTLSAAGSLRDARNQDLVIGTSLEGDFLGANHTGVGGVVLGRVTHNGTTQDIDGTFIAER